MEHDKTYATILRKGSMDVLKRELGEERARKIIQAALDQAIHHGDTLVTYPLGYELTKCGYCASQTPGFAADHVWAEMALPPSYQCLLDDGWRRSGCMLYRPDAEQSCCKLYSIRTIVDQFTPQRSQKKAMSRFFRHFSSPSARRRAESGTPSAANTPYLQSVHEQILNAPGLEIKVVPAAFDAESYRLYRKYQQAIHHSSPEELSEQSYTDFLCSHPLVFPLFPSSSPSSSPALGIGGAGWATVGSTGGGFHCRYYHRDQLFAVGVIDILPSCISSVYFFYDPEWNHLSLGTVSAIVELSLCRQSNFRVPFYYLGYYIDTCQKMRYKARFTPSEILDPATSKWISFQTAYEKFGWSSQVAHQ